MMEISVKNTDTEETRVYRPFGFIEDALGAILEAYMATVDFFTGTQWDDNSEDQWTKEQVRRLEMKLRKTADE